MHQHQTFDITIVGQGVKGLTDPHFQNIGSSGIFRGSCCDVSGSASGVFCVTAFAGPLGPRGEKIARTAMKRPF